MIALRLPAPQAAVIMLPLLLAMDAAGLQQPWRERDRALVRRLVPWGVLGVAYLLPLKMLDVTVYTWQMLRQWLTLGLALWSRLAGRWNRRGHCPQRRELRFQAGLVDSQGLGEEVVQVEHEVEAVAVREGAARHAATKRPGLLRNLGSQPWQSTMVGCVGVVPQR